MNDPLGRDYAVTEEASKESTPSGLYDRKCLPWLFVRHSVCAGPGTFVWLKLQRNDCLDYCRTALGFCTRNQQFYLRHFDRSHHQPVKEAGAHYGNLRSAALTGHKRGTIIKS